MKWRPIPAPPPPEFVLEEHVGPHLVTVERVQWREVIAHTPDGRQATAMRTSYRATQLVDRTRSTLALGGVNAEDCLRRAALALGYEPVLEGDL